MKLIRRFAVIGLVALLSACVSNPSVTELQAAKPAVFAAQQSPIPVSCGDLKPLPVDINITGFYADNGKSGSILDQKLVKEWQAQNKVNMDWKRKVTSLADPKKFTGDDEGVCAVAFIDALAYNNSMLGKATSADGSLQSHYQRKYTLNSVASTYLKVRQYATPEQDERIRWWLTQMSKKNLAFWQEGKYTKGNHYPMSAVGVLVTGILNQDKEMIAWSKKVYFEFLGSVNKQGYLTTELTRGQSALHYHHHSMSQLAALATLSTMIGEDWSTDERYQKLITLITDATIDPTAFEKMVGIKQKPFQANAEGDTGYHMPWYGLLAENDPRVIKIVNAFGRDKVFKPDFDFGGDIKATRRVILAAPKVTIK